MSGKANEKLRGKIAVQQTTPALYNVHLFHDRLVKNHELQVEF